MTGDNKKSVGAGGTFGFFNVRPFLTVLGQVGATVIAFSFHSTNRLRFSTFWALVLFFTFFQPCFGFAVVDSLQACLYVFFIFQVPRRQFSKLLTSAILIFVALIAESQALASQALDNVAFVTPVFSFQRLPS
jgi:hypothetical protein